MVQALADPTNTFQNATDQSIGSAVNAGNIVGPLAAGVGQTAEAVASGVAQASGMAIQAKIIAVSVALGVIIAGIVLYNMFFATSPVDTVTKFVNALNERDYNAAIECLDPKISKAFKATSNILSHFIGINITDILELFPALYEMTKPYGGDIKINVKEVVFEESRGDNARVKINAEIIDIDEAGNARTEQWAPTFYLKKFEEGWRIAGIQD
ncbi:hypothetical protein G7K71_09385 [Desulfofundulus sp. TPOSR]|uniref:hypothetical protein n=1 Tax=Desulfofundulus sp. TPOSR TaxID=2714340 RepID=UPI00140CB8E7|nr:hypothetical protein [Desulfofundulus sp. TPOSR]NHM27193.1 hypothetical protein [Desulfofundulus sp. TPOSR]